jgi:RNA polymerase sigma-70 factor (ECF subfamily)
MELLERFVAGEIDAFEMLFRQFQGEVYRSIARIVRDPAAAEDLTVETFWRIYRARTRFSPDRRFGPWAHRIATHVALDHLKAARPELPLSDEPIDRGGRDGVHQEELFLAIRHGFSRLPPKLRVVATLALVEQLPQAEIAESLGISLAAVKSREFRAVRLLRSQLKRAGFEP